MKRIFFLLACLCLPFFSFAQKAGESRQLTRQDSLRLQQLLNGQVEIVIDDETQQEIDRLFNPEKWKMKSTPFPKKNMKFETELPRYESPEEEKIYVEIPLNKEYLAGYDPRLEPASAGKFTPSALMVGAGISTTFNADKLLGIIFSKKMRAKVKNAKEAKSWEGY